MGAQVKVDVNFRDHRSVIRGAIGLCATSIRDRGRQDVAGALRGRGSKWAKNLITEVKRQDAQTYYINVYLKPGFLHGFERGMTSVGKPLLWIPVPPLRTRVGRYKGKLFHPAGKNVLIGIGRRVRVRGMVGTGGKPIVKYIGVPSITNKKRFHLSDIAYQEALRLVEFMGVVAT
jgi:hypothetical protein